MIKWLIQSNLNDNGYKNLLKSLSEYESNIEYHMIDIIPFSLEYNIPNNILKSDTVIVYGSQSLVDYMKSNGYSPVGYCNENFNYNVWKENYGELLLNYDSIVGKLHEVDTNLEKFFIRPLKDDKSFAGMVIDAEKFKQWRDSILSITDYCTINSETEVSISSIKNIINEHRFFVIDGKISTYSQYVENGKVSYSKNINADVMEFALKAIKKWNPDKAYCLDIATVLTNNKLEHKIIEINCINTCGLYASDTDCYVRDMTTLAGEKYVNRID